MQKPQIIAEIGCNHKGDFNIAKELILLAKNAGAKIVKFQKRNNKELLSKEQYNAPHPNPINSYGKTYGEHREFLEFSLEQHKALKEFCEQIGVIYSTSVWDSTSALEIISLNPAFIKVPSACNTNYELLKIL
ncbi:MAG: N-acetylneuraminate synthase family protein, partial [Helicobacter sp.]|nr:N-acetylneuraminate synthase family protein [Helicobacter sp.]